MEQDFLLCVGLHYSKNDFRDQIIIKKMKSLKYDEISVMKYF